MYRSGLVDTLVTHAKGFGLTPLFGDHRGFMPPQLKTKQNKTKSCWHTRKRQFSKVNDAVSIKRIVVKRLLLERLNVPYV